MRAHQLPMTTPVSVCAVRALCRKHVSLDSLALAELAPIAADGHAAHLILFIAANTHRWTAGEESPPVFVTRSRLAATLTWQQAQEYAADPEARRRLTGHHRVGKIATAHLVGLAEGMIRRIVRQLRLRAFARTTVADLDDMMSIGRAAVAQGVWAYDQTRPSGAHYLRDWIEEHVKRGLAGLTYQVTVPVKTHVRFIRIAGARATLAERLGREPTDEELLALPEATFTQADLDDERSTRNRRWRTGLGLPSASREVSASEPDAQDAQLLRPATHDRSDPGTEDWEERMLRQVDARADIAGAGWRVILDALQIGHVQREIVARSLRLPPYEQLSDDERTDRAVAESLGLRRGVVNNVLRTLRAELGRRGGRVHHLVAGLDDEDCEGLGLQLFNRLLGPLPDPDAPPTAVPPMLTKPVPHGGRCVPSRRNGLLVRYECSGSCGWAGYERASGPRFVLPRISCPDCGGTATATRHRQVGRHAKGRTDEHPQWT